MLDGSSQAEVCKMQESLTEQFVSAATFLFQSHGSPQHTDSVLLQKHCSSPMVTTNFVNNY